MKKRTTWKADLLLLGGILAAGCILGLCLLRTQQQGATVQVRVDGAVVGTFSMTRNQTYEIQGANGGTNLLFIQNGEAWVEEASCPDGLCQNMGKISQNGQSIVCLPNRVVIEVTAGQETDIDFMAG
jgi:hypothetical protein